MSAADDRVAARHQPRLLRPARQAIYETDGAFVIVADDGVPLFGTDDWIDAEATVEAAWQENPHRRLRIRGTHPTHKLVSAAGQNLGCALVCAICGAPDNGCYAIHMPCGYNDQGRPFYAVLQEAMADL